MTRFPCRYTVLLSAILAWGVAVSGTCIGAETDKTGKVPSGSADTHPFITTRLAIRGTVEQSAEYSVDQLATLPGLTRREIPVTNREGQPTGQTEVLEGILLKDLLEQARLVVKEPHAAKKAWVIAIASDGYRVVFSWNELFNTPVGDGVLVMVRRNGQPLDVAEGRIALMSTLDRRLGPRHVRWLKAIEVHKAED